MTTALDRSVVPQDPVFETAMAELSAGRSRPDDRRTSGALSRRRWLRFHHGFGPPWPPRHETVGYPRRSSSQRLGLGDRLTDLTGSEGLDVLSSMKAIYWLGN